MRSRGFEAGLRTSFVPGPVSTVSLWSLDLNSELVFVGDAGGTEPNGASRRYGVVLIVWIHDEKDLSKLPPEVVTLKEIARDVAVEALADA